jgi:UDP:flavonoid glycosyltransferase YjiC (YdhE family)
LFFAARLAAKTCNRANAVMAHMALLRVAEPFRGLIAHFNGLHDEAGLAPLPSFDDLTFSDDPVIVASLAAIGQGRAALKGAGNVRYVGPALEMEADARPIALPWDKDDPRPLALISFSTDPIQANPDLIQRTLDSLAPLGLRVVATVGRAIDPDRLAVPANAVVAPAANHDALMSAAALVVTHGGHGTVMRALKHGAPMLVLPGFVPEQAPNAAIVAELGAGRILGQDSDAAAIRAAAEDILRDPAYRAKARHAAGLFGPRDGAIGAADEVEKLLAGKPAAEPA